MIGCASDRCPGLITKKQYRWVARAYSVSSRLEPVIRAGAISERSEEVNRKVDERSSEEEGARAPDVKWGE